MSQLEFTYCNLWRVHVGSSQKGHKELPSPCCFRHLIDFIYIIFVGGLYDSGQIMSPQMTFFPLIKRIQMILYSRCMSGFSKNCPNVFLGEPGEFGHFAEKVFALGVETPRKWMSWLVILKIDVFPVWKKSESVQSSYLCVNFLRNISAIGGLVGKTNGTLLPISLVDTLGYPKSGINMVGGSSNWRCFPCWSWGPTCAAWRIWMMRKDETFMTLLTIYCFRRCWTSCSYDTMNLLSQVPNMF